MNTPSSRSQPAVPLALVLAFAALMGLLSVTLEGQFSLSAGYVTLAALALPTAFAGAVLGVREGAVVGGFAAVACATSWLNQAYARFHDIPLNGWLMPVCGGLVLLAVGVGLGLWNAATGRQREAREAEKAKLVRDLYQLRREAAERTDADAPAAPAAPARPAPASPARSLDYGALLLKVQDIGKSISSALDLASLAAIVPDVSRKLVGADRCELFLLDESGTHLVGQHDGRDAHLDAGAGLFGWVLANRQLLTHDYAERDYNLRGLVDSQLVPCYAAAPLVVGREVMGVLSVAEVREPPAEFDRLLRILANFTSLGVRNARLFERIEAMAKRDGLTGLFNHATFQSALADAVDRALGTSGICAVVLADVDHFKGFNDTHGHRAGDFVLKQIAAQMQAAAPERAMVARYGGEEFVLLLPDQNAADAHALADRIRADLAATPLAYEGVELHVTASFGVADCPAAAGTPSDLVQKADDALYAAKESGRNRVCTADAVQAGHAAAEHGAG